jgi:hypothetical protein
VLYDGDVCFGGATIERTWNRADTSAAHAELRAAV